MVFDEVDVEQRALRPFEQQVGAGFPQAVQNRNDVGHHGTDLLGDLQRFVQRLLKIDGFDLVVIGEHEVVIVHHFGELRGELLQIEQVTEPNAAARSLVFVCRSDAATGSAVLHFAALILAREIERRVICSAAEFRTESGAAPSSHRR